MKNIKVTLIQSDLHWENAAKNRDSFSQKIDEITEQTDVIVLPEMFSTGFSMNSATLSETMNGLTIEWMKHQAIKKNAAIVGSLIIIENEHFYNRLIWVQPDGVLKSYDKRHLFRMANEHEYFSSGKDKLIVEWRGWKFCPLVCYDLRFPVWSRNKSTIHNQQTSYEYDCLIYIASWPEVRKIPWTKLLEARAIENLSYVVGVNRVGVDGRGNSYSGNSAVINPQGEPISTIQEYQNSIQTIEMNRIDLNKFREKFPAGLDSDNFEIID